jgi:hypothetical protein
MTAGSNAQTWLALLVGGLLVAVVALGWFVYARTHVPPQVPSHVSVDLAPSVPLPEGPKMPNAPIPKPQ